jgi:hypothetical protein
MRRAAADAGGIEPVCTDAPDGARPRGERKDALDTVALRRCRAQVASIAAVAAAAALGVKHALLLAASLQLGSEWRVAACGANAPYRAPGAGVRRVAACGAHAAGERAAGGSSPRACALQQPTGMRLEVHARGSVALSRPPQAHDA